MRDYQNEPMQFQFSLALGVCSDVNPEVLGPAIKKHMLGDAGFNEFFQYSFQNGYVDPCGQYKYQMEFSKLTVEIQSDEPDEPQAYYGDNEDCGGEPIMFNVNVVLNVHGAVELEEIQSAVTDLHENVDIDYEMIDNMCDEMGIPCYMNTLTVSLIA